MKIWIWNDFREWPAEWYGTFENIKLAIGEDLKSFRGYFAILYNEPGASTRG